MFTDILSFFHSTPLAFSEAFGFLTALHMLAFVLVPPQAQPDRHFE